MRCSACGWENAVGRKSCGGCGAVLPSVCLFCGARSEPGSRFCEACNSILNANAPAPAKPVVPLPTSFVSGRYHVLGLIGEGANKIVYLCHDMRLHRDVAFALVKIDGLDETARASLRREVRSLARLGDHPRVVTVYDVGQARRSPCIVSQYMAGGSLQERLKKSDGNRLPIADAVRIAAEVCEALEHAHARGVLHRDLKPANVLFTQDGETKLSDLGFGLILATELSSLMGASMAVSTVAYTAPEQALAQPFDARSDLYSLGAMLYEMVTGRPPFLGENLAAVVTQHLNLPPAPPSWRVLAIPPSLEALILRLLAKSPEERPASAEATREELRTIGAEIAAAIAAAAPSLAALHAVAPAAAVQNESSGPATPALEAARPPMPPSLVMLPPVRDTTGLAARREPTNRAHASAWLAKSLGATSRHPMLAGAGLMLLLVGLGTAQLRRAWEVRGSAALHGESDVTGASMGESKDDVEALAGIRDATRLAIGSPGAKFLTMAEAGDAHAQARLGDMYLRGSGLGRDYDTALKWLRKAAEQGDLDAKLDLGLMSARGEGVPQDYSEALQWFYQAASDGNRDAQYNLGELYRLGEGVANDYAVAVEWLRKAAEQGSVEAECEMGRLYRTGEGVAQSDAAALEWMNKAAAQGSRDGEYEVGKFYLLGEGVTQDYLLAAQWFRKAAAQGDAQAENALGYMYEQGQGVSQDYDEAQKWYRQAAAAGDPKAPLNLGLMYEDGEGVAQDFAQATRWYREAAARGDAVAQANLGFMYWKGRGVSKDYNQAYQWFFKAAAQGNAQAQYALGAMYDNGRGVRKDYGQAAEWYTRAAAQGNRDAQYNLGYMYQYGQGVSQDLAKALQWYRKAADQGDADAVQELRDFVIGGTTTAAAAGAD